MKPFMDILFNKINNIKLTNDIKNANKTKNIQK